MAFENVVLVSVPVSDQDRARDFYVDILGFELTREDDSVPGFRWVQVRPTGAATQLSLVTWFDTMPAGSLRGLVLTSSNLEADYEWLRDRGVEFDGPPQQQPWGMETVFSDPDGNKLVLHQA